MFNKTVLMVKDTIVIYRKSKTVLILVSSKCYFSHPEESILKSFLIALTGCKLEGASCLEDTFFLFKVSDWSRFLVKITSALTIR